MENTQNTYITVVHQKSRRWDTLSDHIEYDLEKKVFYFGCYEEYSVTYEDDSTGFDFSLEMENTIRNCYLHGMSPTGAQYYVDENDPTKLYFAPADDSDIPRVIFDGNYPERINPDFIDETVEEEPIMSLKLRSL